MTVDTRVLHLVLLGWEGSATDAQKRDVVEGMRGLQQHIPGILDVQEGVSVSPEGLENGHDHVFAMTFDSVAARDAYLPHPAHVAVAHRIRAAARLVTVFDLAVDDRSTGPETTA